MHVKTVKSPALPRARGMTLLELLLAVSVFSLLAATAYGALQSMTTTSIEQRDASEQLRQVQLLAARMQREMEQAISYEHPDGQNGLGMSGGPQGFRFASLGGSNPQAGAEIVIVGYTVAGTALQREASPAQSQTTPRGQEPLELLAGIDRSEISYFSAAGGWQPDWSGSSGQPLPDAVRLTIESSELGRIERIFVLPGQR